MRTVKVSPGKMEEGCSIDSNSRQPERQKQTAISKEIVPKTRELLAVAIFMSSAPHFWAPRRPPHFLLPNPTNRIDQTDEFPVVHVVRVSMVKTSFLSL
ncbi:MAG: hypothetical protein ACYS6K_15935 [Planctomycetota bacterium]|jgi:hypothetical protein